MSEIWKFEITYGVIELHVPITGRGVLSAGQDHKRDNCLWIEVDPEKPSVPVTVAIAGTGHKIPDDHRFRFVGTICDGPMRWHVFVKHEPLGYITSGGDAP